MALPERILESVRSLKPLPQNAMRLLETVRDPNHTVQDIARIVETDAALTGNILRVVNSPAFGLRVEVTTVARAIPFLGDRMTVGIALNLCASQLFNRSLEGYEGEKGSLWRHSMKTAIASKEIARYTNGRVNPDEAYTAGILHDLGKSIISQYLEGRTHELVQTAESGNVRDYLGAESETLGTDHSEVGAALAVHWKLPPALVEVLAHHHSPAQSSEPHRPLVYTIHLGDFVSMMGGAGTGSDTLLYRIDENYKDYISISRQELELVFLHTEQEFEKTLSAMFAE